MGDEESIRKEVWDGKIPVCFTLADEDVGYSVSGERSNPEPVYVSYKYLLETKLGCKQDDVFHSKLTSQQISYILVSVLRLTTLPLHSDDDPKSRLLSSCV